jgi:hypothetical protein
MIQSHRFLARGLKMSGIMKEMSQQMTGMSKMMTKGTAYVPVVPWSCRLCPN